MSRALMLIVVLVIGRQVPLEAASILGFSLPGGTSHQAAMSTIGLELTRRGHTFTLLLSSADELSHSRLAHEPFDTLKVLNFSGPPGVGTQAWRETIPRDPAEASFLLKRP